MDTVIKTKLEEVSSFFNNPLTTPVGIRVDQCTNPTLPSDNWQLLLEICDHLNSPIHDQEATLKDFARAVKKKLNVKNNVGINYTLTLIEVSVKNCGHSENFRRCILNKDFVGEMVKVMAKADTPQEIQDKILSLIQSWSLTFKDNEQLTSIYEELREKGIEFPATNVDHNAPILLEDYEPVMHPVELSGGMKPTPAQAAKLRSDLASVQSNIQVFNEILSEGGESEAQFLEELYTTCKEMQRRLTILLGTVGDDAVLEELLLVNDEMNSVFLRYTRSLKNKKKPVDSLIDFSVESKKESGAVPKIRPVRGPPVVSSNSTINEPKPEFTESDTDFDEIMKTHTESDFHEMEEWLKTFPPQQQIPLLPQQANTQATLSSSEFDQFLMERAKKK